MATCRISHWARVQVRPGRLLERAHRAAGLGADKSLSLEALLASPRAHQLPGVEGAVEIAAKGVGKQEPGVLLRHVRVQQLPVGGKEAVRAGMFRTGGGAAGGVRAGLPGGARLGDGGGSRFRGAPGRSGGPGETAKV